MKRYLLILLISWPGYVSMGQSLTDSLALESFMDGIIQTHLDEKKIAGAALAIVHIGFNY